MVPSKSDYALALVSNNHLAITIRREGKIMRKTETEAVKCLDFTASNSDICCYSSKNNLIIWNFEYSCAAVHCFETLDTLKKKICLSI